MVTRTEKNKKNRNKIKSQDMREKRFNAYKRIFNIIFSIVITVTIICIIVFVYSTTFVKVNEYSNLYTNLPQEFHGYKIIQFGDTYYDKTYSYLFNKAIKKINKLKPDVLIFSGNLICNNYDLDEITKNNIISELKNIKVSTGKYYVTGENDNELTKSIMNESGFVLLDDTYIEIYKNELTPIIISGIKNKYDLNTKIDSNLFNLTIINNSNNIDNVLEYTSPDIILSGNNINGQVRLPYFGSIKKYKYPNNYYYVNNSRIYITSGIGTNNIPVRIFDLPSINFFRLKAK